MLTNILISCVLFAIVQASYSAPASYDSYKVTAKPSSAGYVAQVQPAASLIILPYYGIGKGASASAAAATSASSYSSAEASQSHAADLDPEILNLIKLVFSLPSAGGSNADLIKVPHYPKTVYTAPVIELSSDKYSNAVSGSSAAAAAANNKSRSARSGYSPAPAPAQYAGSGYGPVAAASESA